MSIKESKLFILYNLNSSKEYNKNLNVNNNLSFLIIL